MSALAQPTLRRLPLGAAVASFGALAATLVLPTSAGIAAAGLLGVVAVLLLIAELMRRGRALIRSGLGAQIALALLGAAVLGAAWSVVVSAHLEYFGAAFALGTGGAALVVLSLLRLADEVGPGRTPWQALTGGLSGASDARARFRRLAPLLTGALAMLLALRLLVESLAGVVGSAPDGAMLLTLLMLAVFVVGPGWALRGVYERLAEVRRPAPPQRDQQLVAAHLHDSVLQTLSLIGRTADDPARVRQLARQQERSLRAWLAGRDEAQADSLAGAVRVVAQEVEDEEPGARIEVVAVGDAPLDRVSEALVGAAREAMRNAVRHAGAPVRVFVEVHASGARELFIRDTGPGFALAHVDDERRGIRDAIIGRIEHVGGSATIDSSPAGTEIGLRHPAEASGFTTGEPA